MRKKTLRLILQTPEQQKKAKRLTGYLIYTDGWLWFGHVTVLLRTSNSWVKINHSFSYTQVDVLPLRSKWAADIKGELQKFVIDVPYEQKRYAFGMFSCVEQTKSLLGIKAWWVLTPKQLRRYIDAKIKQEY